jgi:hypothetical protein
MVTPSRRGSVSSPVGFHDGQLYPEQSHLHPMPLKIPSLHLNACQNAIDHLNRDRKPAWRPVKCVVFLWSQSDCSFARCRIFSSYGTIHFNNEVASTRLLQL